MSHLRKVSLLFCASFLQHVDTSLGVTHSKHVSTSLVGFVSTNSFASSSFNQSAVGLLQDSLQCERMLVPYIDNSGIVDGLGRGYSWPVIYYHQLERGPHFFYFTLYQCFLRFCTIAPSDILPFLGRLYQSSLT